MMGDTTMILALSNSNDSKYSLYSLNTKSGFSVTGKTPTDGSAVVMSISCMDRVILVATKEGIDYWGWDDGTGFNFPVPEPIATPSDTPGASGPNYASPTFTPSNGVNTPSNNNTTDGLTHDNQVLVGVLVGVGVPLLAGATTLILLRKKLHKKKKPEDKESIYSAINVPSKDNPSFSSKMLIPFKQLSFGKEIGSGSFGKVFLGKWRGAVVAIKMNNRVAFTEGFSAEAKLTLSMTPHPNLVQTYGVSIDSDHPYIVLEYCEGGSLDQIVFKQTLGSKEQRAIVLGIAYGLTHLHENKIIHRDLAVRNILLKDGTPKISDFGMSRILKEETSHGKTYTSIGPIRWMAPESVLDMSYSYKSDVWTFGIVVSEIVNGHEPHEGENQLNVAMQIRDEGYTPPIPDDCDPVLRELMQMCWRVNPDDRPTMNEVTDFLNDKLTQQ
jgi:predicted Ser/Thr protein kinase